MQILRDIAMKLPSFITMLWADSFEDAVLGPGFEQFVPYGVLGPAQARRYLKLFFDSGRIGRGRLGSRSVLGLDDEVGRPSERWQARGGAL